MEERNANLQAQLAQLAEHVAESRGDQRTTLHRLHELEASERQQQEMAVALQRQTDALDALRGKVDELSDQMAGIAGRVSEIEKEPGERWQKMGFEIIKYIVLAAVGAALGYLIK